MADDKNVEIYIGPAARRDYPYARGQIDKVIQEIGTERPTIFTLGEFHAEDGGGDCDFFFKSISESYALRASEAISRLEGFAAKVTDRQT